MINYPEGLNESELQQFKKTVIQQKKFERILVQENMDFYSRSGSYAS